VTDQPYLFSCETRAAVFNVLALDPLQSLDPSGPQQWSLIMKVRRDQKDHFFEDGCNGIEAFAPSRIPIEIHFSGEKGVGRGPTHEFFS